MAKNYHLKPFIKKLVLDADLSYSNKTLILYFLISTSSFFLKKITNST